MDLLHRLKAKYHHGGGGKHTKAIRRRQFNMTIAEEIILGVKFIAAILEVPQYVACEHILQVGRFHLLKAISDPEKQQKLTEHLVKAHLLGNELSDDESILRLGETE